MNPTNPANAASARVFTEVQCAGAQQYESTSSSSITPVAFDAAKFESALGSLRGALANTAIVVSLSRFALGYLHDQFQDHIAPNEAVDSLELSDDYANMVTRTRQPVFFIQARIDCVSAFPSPFAMPFGLQIGVNSLDVYATGETVGGAKSNVAIQSSRDVPTRWQHYGEWYAWECDQIKAVTFTFSGLIRVYDAFGKDATGSIVLPSCAQINQVAAGNRDANFWFDEQAFLAPLGESGGQFEFHMAYRVDLTFR